MSTSLNIIFMTFWDLLGVTFQSWWIGSTDGHVVTPCPWEQCLLSKLGSRKRETPSGQSDGAGCGHSWGQQCWWAAIPMGCFSTSQQFSVLLKQLNIGFHSLQYKSQLTNQNYLSPSLIYYLFTWLLFLIRMASLAVKWNLSMDTHSVRIFRFICLLIGFHVTTQKVSNFLDL